LKKAHRKKILEMLNARRSSLSRGILSAATNSRELQLMGLCNVWGAVKYLHPFLVYRDDIDWDRALIETLNKIGSNAVSALEYKTAVKYLLSKLKDSNTKVHEEMLSLALSTTATAKENGVLSSPPKKEVTQSEASPQSPQSPSSVLLTQPSPSSPSLEKAKDISSLADSQKTPSSPPPIQIQSPLPPPPLQSPQQFGHIQQSPPLSQPYVSITSSGVAIITTTDYDQFIELTAYNLLLNAIYTALSSSNNIVFDVRSMREEVKSTSAVSLTVMYFECLKLFLTEDITLPTVRHRVFHGYPEHRPGYAQIFHHGFMVLDAEVMKSDPSQRLQFQSHINEFIRHRQQHIHSQQQSSGMHSTASSPSPPSSSSSLSVPIAVSSTSSSPLSSSQQLSPSRESGELSKSSTKGDSSKSLSSVQTQTEMPSKFESPFRHNVSVTSPSSQSSPTPQHSALSSITTTTTTTTATTPTLPTLDKTLIFIFDKNSPQGIIDIALSLRAQKNASIIYQVNAEDGMFDPDTNDFIPFEPGVSTTLLHLPFDVEVSIRINEKLSPDGSVGFNPDFLIINNPKLPLSTTTTPNTSKTNRNDSNKDSALLLAIDLCSGKIPRKQREKSYRALFPRRKFDEEYKTFVYPSVEYRYLALCRLWNAVHYFYPYKHLLDKSWDQIFFEFLPRFESASNAIEYTLAITEMVNTLNDTHSYVRNAVVSNYIGTHIPPIRVKTIQNHVVVTHLLEQSLPIQKSEHTLQVGDEILEVDGENVNKRRKRLESVFGGSTDVSRSWRIDHRLLAGAAGTMAKLKVTRKISEVVSKSNVASPEKSQPATISASESTTRGTETESIASDREQLILSETSGTPRRITFEIEIQRTMQPQQFQALRQGPAYTLLDHLDSHGNKIAYLDLTRIQFHEVDIALEMYHKTTSMILDLRGYIKGIIYRLAPKLARKKVVVSQTTTPILSPSLLVDDLHSGLFHTTQMCAPMSGNSEPYKGMIVGLIDIETISHGEHSVLYLKAIRPDIILIGNRTSGSVGNQTNIVLPGGVLVGFTAMGLQHPNGDEIQRKGILPDIVVEETLESMLQEKDATLDAALNYLRTNSIPIQSSLHQK
jgi:C-terminal processing protease CtpA/Prc